MALHDSCEHNGVELFIQVTSNCVSCGVQFGKYFCAICRMYDDTDKQQFHCDQCGICRFVLKMSVLIVLLS
jgi:hypothetical protein